MMKRLVLAAAIASTLAGCATPFATQHQATSIAASRASDAIKEFDAQGQKGVVREVTGPSADFQRTDAPVKRGDIYVKASGAPFAPLVTEMAKQAGYSVAFGEAVDPMRKVTVDFNGAFTEDAIRTTAFLAGYAAVFDRDAHTLYVSDVATYNYHMPTAAFQSLQATYSVGGNPANSTGSSGSGSGGNSSGGSSGGTTLKADFTITGSEGTNGKGLEKFLKDLAGANATVLVNDQGTVSVRGNAQALRRVNDFLKGFTHDAMTQVEIEASVIEVSLTNDFNLGIQWGRVLNNAGKGFFTGGTADLASATIKAATGGDTSTLIGQAASAAANGSIGGYRTTANSAAIINALMQFTDVKVVSQPKLVALNNNPATFFDGTQIPYVGQIQQTANTSSGGSTSNPTVSGSVSFAIDGVSFSAVPSVVNKNSVQITLMPVLSSVGTFSNFLNGQLTAPTQANKQTYMRVLAENGKTLILGGIRYNKDVKDTSYGTKTSRSSTAKEVVILLRANVVPPASDDIIMNESL